jgi:hypothetical protein
MNSTILYGSNLPELTNILMGMVTMSDNTLSQFNSNINDLSDSDKFIINEFTNLTSFNTMVNINNSSIYFDCTMVTPNNVLTEMSDIDYLTLNTNDTTIINNFITLIRKLSNI